MNKPNRYSIFILLLCCFTAARGQIAMPDTVCLGTSRIYSVNDATKPSTYNWKIDGVLQNSNTNSLAVTWNKTGNYLITVQEHSSGGCDGDVRSGIVVVKAPAIANAGPDQQICFGLTTRLSASGGTVYQWTPASNLSNPNIANPVFSALNAGTYTYVLSVLDANACGIAKKDTVVIRVLTEAKIFAGRDTAIVTGQPLQLQAVDISNAGFINYSWSPGFGLNNSFIPNPIANISSDITYTITATTPQGCSARDDISIKVAAKAEIYVPNAFTPNGDRKNDVLKVIPVGIKTLHYFRVYNRYGQLVFSTEDYTKGWDGIYQRKEQGTGAFVWVAEGVDYLEHVIARKGTVILVR